jgi:hypothetical protein
VEFTNIVTRGRPLKRTVAPLTKLVPLTVRVEFGPPAGVFGGTSEVIVGEGLPAGAPPWNTVNVWHPNVAVSTRAGPVFCATV